MLLTLCYIDDIMHWMKPLLFRQWVACVMMLAVLFSTTAPLGFCLCEGCHCKNSISLWLPKSAVADTKCCCTLPEPMSEKDCCGSPEAPCSCSCGDIRNDGAVVPAMVPSAKQPKIYPSWNVVSVLPTDFVDISGAVPLLGNRWALPPPHVPLHVFLCVFLN